MKGPAAEPPAPPEPDPRILRLLSVLPVIGGVASTGVGALVLAGWALHVEILKSLLPNFASMKPNTALAFVLVGLALVVESRPRASARTLLAGRVLAAVAGVIGLLTLIEYATGADLGIDQLLFTDDPGSVLTAAPGRMAFTTALDFMLACVALLLVDPRDGRRAGIVQGACLIAAIPPLLSAIGYSFGARAFFQVLPTHTAQALHTALLFLIALAGIAAVGPPRGAVAQLASSRLGGQLARRFLPVALLLPLVVAWIRLAGERAGLYGIEFGLAVMVTATTVLLGASLFLAAVFLNRTDAEREAAQVAERDLARRLQSVLDNATTLIYMKDLEGRYLMANSRFEEVFGLEHATIIGSTDAEALTDAEAEVVGAGDAETIAGGKPVEDEIVIPHPGGARTYITVRFPLRDDKGAPYALGAVATDISERKRMEDELRTLNIELEDRVEDRTRELAATVKELEAFSYTVSHDLRSPLRAMDGFSRILLEEYAGDLPSGGVRYLNMVRDGARQMGVLIDDLLAFSRLSRQPLKRRDVDIADVVYDAYETVRAAEPADREVELIMADLGPMNIDPAMMKQVFVNLLSNSLKFTRDCEAARVEVGCIRRDRADAAVCYVRDNGVGFDMQYSNKLFGVFQRLHSAAEYEGTGVGLAIVQRVVHRHHGDVWAESEPGAGATFYFTVGKGDTSDDD